VRLLVTGANGMLGRDVLRACDHAGLDCVGLPRTELDITDAQACVEAIGEHRPDAVINCAAWTDVDGAEADEAGALKVNGTGAENVARACATSAHPPARLVHVSTDYVFDGAARRPYVESDPVAPIGAYGRTKLEGERLVAQALPSAAIARSAWLFGTGGKNFVDTMLRLAADRGEVTVVDDQVGCPTWTGHLAPALIALAGAPDRNGVFHVAGTGQCSWLDFALEIFAQAGVDCQVHRGSSADLRRPAPRPAWSVLGTERDGPELPDWTEGLAGFLAERTAGART
jgi:dTDP-4-dehydrorhamnose reductase